MTKNQNRKGTMVTLFLKAFLSLIHTKMLAKLSLARTSYAVADLSLSVDITSDYQLQKKLIKIVLTNTPFAVTCGLLLCESRFILFILFECSCLILALPFTTSIPRVQILLK